MTVATAVVPPREQVTDFCQRHHIRWLALFGSVLTDAFNSNSDVEVLVEFQPGHVPVWSIVGIEAELSELFGGRRVDLILRSGLNRWMRDRVLREAQVLHAEG